MIEPDTCIDDSAVLRPRPGETPEIVPKQTAGTGIVGLLLAHAIEQQAPGAAGPGEVVPAAFGGTKSGLVKRRMATERQCHAPGDAQQVSTGKADVAGVARRYSVYGRSIRISMAGCRAARGMWSPRG